MELTRKLEAASSIHTAAFEGDLLELEGLVFTENEVNVPDPFGNTPLIYACCSKVRECVIFLQEKGANHEAKDNNGLTALQHTCIQGDTDVLDLIIKHSNVNTQDNENSTPLHKAALYNKPNCLEKLLKHGAKPNVANKHGQTPLHHAAEMGNLECVKILVENGAEVQAAIKVESEGNSSAHTVLYSTPLQAAILSGNVECISFLLSKGAVLSGNDKKIILHQLARNGNVKALDFLIEHINTNSPQEKATVDEKDSNGRTPLLIASYFGFLELVERLIEKGASLNIVDNDGCTPLHYAAYKNHGDIVSLLLEKGLPVDSRDNSKSTALHKAASTNATSCVELLIRRGADVNARDIEGAAPIHKAAFKGHIDCVRLPIEKGCDPQVKDEDGATALHKAAYGGHTSCLNILIEKGCKLFDRDNHNEQPVDYARANKAAECVKVLTELKESIINKSIEMFNSKPAKGIEYGQSERLIGSHSRDIASFLYNTEELDKALVGEYIGGKKSPAEVLSQYLKLFDFSGSEIDVGLRRLVKKFRLAGEAQNISRILEEFSTEWFKQNPSQKTFGSGDSVFVLAFSIIMLNTDAHNVNVKNKMTLEEFVKNNRGINSGQDLPIEYLQGIYDRIVNDEIKMKEDEDLTDLQDLRKGWLSIFKRHTVRNYWKRYFFMLSDDGQLIRYYKSDNIAQDPEVVGEIPLSSIKISMSEKERKTCIKIVCTDDIKYGGTVGTSGPTKDSSNLSSTSSTTSTASSTASQTSSNTSSTRKQASGDKIPIKTYYMVGDTDIDTNRWMKVLTAALKKLSRQQAKS